MSDATVPTTFGAQPASSHNVPNDATHSEVVVRRIQDSTNRLSQVLDRLIHIRNAYFGPAPPTAVAEPDGGQGDPETKTFTDAFEHAHGNQMKMITAIESITDELQRIA